MKRSKRVLQWIFGLLILVVVVGVISSLLHPKESKATAENLNYQLVSAEDTDQPLKAQWVIKIMLPESTDTNLIKDILLDVFKQYRNKRGNNWHYHSKPTLIYIYAYDDEDIARDPNGTYAWVAMLEWNTSYKEPSMRIQDKTLLALNKERFYSRKFIEEKYGSKEKWIVAMFGKLRTPFCKYLKETEPIDNVRISVLEKYLTDFDDREKTLLDGFEAVKISNAWWLVYTGTIGNLKDSQEIYWVDALYNSVVSRPDYTHNVPAVRLECSDEQ